MPVSIFNQTLISFSAAARPEQAERLYLVVAGMLRAHGIRVETGRFQTHMQVSLCNDGPVTLLLDSKKNVLRFAVQAII